MFSKSQARNLFGGGKMKGMRELSGFILNLAANFQDGELPSLIERMYVRACSAHSREYSAVSPSTSARATGAERRSSTGWGWSRLQAHRCGSLTLRFYFLRFLSPRLASLPEYSRYCRTSRAYHLLLNGADCKNPLLPPFGVHNPGILSRNSFCSFFFRGSQKRMLGETSMIGKMMGSPRYDFLPDVVTYKSVRVFVSRRASSHLYDDVLDLLI